MEKDAETRRRGDKERHPLRVSLSPRPRILPGPLSWLGNSIAFLLFFFFTLLAQAAPPDLWPMGVQAIVQPADREKLRVALNTATLPVELKPAVQFQITLLKILNSGTSKAQPLEPEWVNDLRAFIAADREDDPVAHGVAEVSRAWLARIQMRKIDSVLHQYYRRNVRFPDQFSAILPDLPEPLRLDPWGQPWIYQPRAPEGFVKLTGQRYQLGPTQFPELGSLNHHDFPIFHTRKPTLTLRTIGNKRALEIRTPASTAIIQAGGKTESSTLLYIGENWALFAGADQLFADAF